ncbi:MAG: nucleotidyltransferase family protein [Elusimicrobia bacterium]|nr:nucleotidyltransferase family protein [Elusimicrobiota bacterium]
MKTKFLKEHPELILNPKATLREAIKAVTGRDGGIALICDEERRLLGILVDADMRHALLRGATPDSLVSEVMNAKPVVVDGSISDAELTALFDRQRRSFIPVVDGERRLVGLARIVDYLKTPRPVENWVVIMAGGQGTRLRPFTNDCPKPMMKIGDKPLLELVLKQLIDYGLNRFVLSVNYLADQIRDHFGDGSRFGVTIEYVSEPSALGTAGALSLITRKFDQPFIVMNGDLLTMINFRSLLDFHEKEGNLGTMCVREYDFQVPYGVVQLDDNKLAALIEKPVHRFFVNAGIYVLEPGTLSRLQSGKRRDMPDLFEELRREAPRKVGCFPIQEYWLDIGKIEDYQKALQEYDANFLAK